MPIVSRGYRLEDDFQRVMGFLRDTYAETKSLHNWFPSRFENSHREMVPHTCIYEEFKEGVPEPKIVAMANPEIEFIYFIQIHPDYGLLGGGDYSMYRGTFHLAETRPV